MIILSWIILYYLFNTMFSLRVADKSERIKLSELMVSVDTEFYKPSQERSLLEKYLDEWKVRFLLWEEAISWCIIISHEPLSTQIRCIISKRKWGWRFMIEQLQRECLERKDKKLRCWSRSVLQVQWFYEALWFSEQFLIKKFEFWEDCWFFWKTLS